jgi:hypothetical protein
MKDVADDGPGRTGDDADDRRQERQELLAGRVEQTLKRGGSQDTIRSASARSCEA